MAPEMAPTKASKTAHHLVKIWATDMASKIGFKEASSLGEKLVPSWAATMAPETAPAKALKMAHHSVKSWAPEKAS